MSYLIDKALSFYKSGKLIEAIKIYEEIIKKDSKSFESKHALGVIYLKLKDYDKAIFWTKKALEIEPKNHAIYNNLGAIYLILGKLYDAINFFSEALRLKPDYAQAYNSLGIIYKKLENYEEAIKNFNNAIKYQPDYAEAYLGLGTVLIDKKEFLLSEDYFNKALKLKPNYAEAYLRLGNLKLKLKKYDEAINYCNRALKISPSFVEAYLTMSSIYLELKKYTEAIDICKKVLKIKPDYAEAYNDMAIIYKSMKKYQISVDYFNKSIELKNDYAEAYNNLGITYKDLEKYEKGITCCEKSIKIKPNYAQAYLNLGVLNLSLKKYDKCIKYFNKAIEIKPNYSEAYNNRGVLYLDLKNYDQSLKDFTKAIKINSEYAEAYYNRSVYYAENKKHNLAIRDIYEALRLEPDNSSRYGHLLGCKNEICEWSDLKSILSIITKKILEDNYIEFPVFTLLNHSDNLDTIQKLVDFDIGSQTFFSPLIKKNKNKKIKIGYFSGDFKQHPVGNIISKIFNTHDKNKFEIYGFSSNPKHNIEDELTKKILVSVDKFFDLTTLTDEQILNNTKDYDLDIAIDLAGHTAHGRSRLFKKRIAPIQINFLGYPGTTGKYNDYIIADKNIIPEMNKKYYFEKIIYMPNFFLPNNNERNEKNDEISKKNFNIPERNFVFACFNNCTKINPFIFNCWMRILKKVNNSVILFIEFNKYAKENLIIEASKRNVNPSRLIFCPLVDFNKRLSRYKLCDLFLDTFPYTAHSTANECLWSGTPLLTLVGESFQSRVSFSLLKQLEIKELVAHNIEDYEKKAITLASNDLQLNKVRNKLHESLKNTTLFNMDIYVKNLEKGYIEIFKNYEENIKFKDIYI